MSSGPVNMVYTGGRNQLDSRGCPCPEWAELDSPCPASLSSSSGNATGEGAGRSWPCWMDKCPLGVQKSCGAAFTSSLEAGEREEVGEEERIKRKSQH